MRTLIVIILVNFLQFNKISCQSEYGGVFPIPLSISNEDSNFQHCPNENGAYVHTANCSLFHMCTFGIHRIYSCINGFFFNPTSRRCQYLPVEKEMKCETILEKMMDPFVELVIDRDSDYHRKSSISKCTQTGIYPDILDCSLFHYCHENKHHEIFKCPNGFNFDPKTFLCSALQLVNCQYEPSLRIEDETESICRDYAPGTYLPMPNHFDEFIICGNDGRSISMKCKSGFIYNALTTACENGPCTFDSTLCKNEGQCIDDPTNEKGFKCICPNQFQGEFCEKGKTLDIHLEETTEEMTHENSDNIFQKINFDQTTHIPYTEKVKYFRKNKASNNFLQDKSLLHSNSDQQQPFEEIIKMGLIFILTLIGLGLLGSIIFGIVILTRLILYHSAKTVGEWNTLREESSV